jgi:crotonobetainyl-CoA:carnitine CoA-transferase CaiB-like acyl-CoA transferase
MDARTLMHQAQDRGIMLMAFNTVGELITDPQLAGEGFFREVPCGDRTLVEAGPPYRFATGLPHHQTVPPLGRYRRQMPVSETQARAGTRGGEFPLSGIRVVDFTWVIAGPLMTKWLAALGAEVIKIERFKTGTALNRGNMSPDSVVSFTNLNVGKRSLALDLGFEESREIVRDLVRQSDVVVDNFSPDVLPRWGFSPESLAVINPRIVSMSMPALGSTGPHRGYKGLGSYFQARAGLDGLIGYSHQDIVDVGFAYADTTCNASHATIALLAALVRRDATGRGEHIELRQLESSINFLGPAVLEYSSHGVEPARMGSRSTYAAPHGIYPCAGDDQWCVITVFDDLEWRALCASFGHKEWTYDPRFRSVEDRKVNENELDALISGWTRSRPPETVESILQAAGVGAGMVQNAAQLIDEDPQIAHRKFYARFDSGMVVEGVPFTLCESPANIVEHLPTLGEDTGWVLRERLSLDENRIAELIKIGAVGEPAVRA